MLIVCIIFLNIFSKYLFNVINVLQIQLLLVTKKLLSLLDIKESDDVLRKIFINMLFLRIL